MKLTKGLTNRLATFGAIVVAGALTANLPAQPQPGKAIAEAVKGPAVYTTPGAAAVPLKKGTVLQTGATIETGPGATVDLFLGNSAGYVRLSENTTLVLDKLALTDTGIETVVDVQLNLPAGTMLFDTKKKLSAASKYEIKIPNGVAGIRGSSGRVSAIGFIVLCEGKMVIVWVPATGNPTPYTLIAPPCVYFSALEGVKPAPDELIREYNGQKEGMGKGGVAAAPGAPPSAVSTDPLQRGMNGPSDNIREPFIPPTSPKDTGLISPTAPQQQPPAPPSPPTR